MRNLPRASCRRSSSKRGSGISPNARPKSEWKRAAQGRPFLLGGKGCSGCGNPHSGSCRCMVLCSWQSDGGHRGSCLNTPDCTCISCTADKDFSVAVPYLDAAARHPIVLPDGSTYPNTAYPKQVIDHLNISVGDFTYYNDFEPMADCSARIAPYLHPGAPERLRIGKFCQFAHGTRFITASANHPKGWLTAYPFAVFDRASKQIFAEEFAKGSDTHIGHNAMVLPGFTLGHGVIVGAGAVVARDEPDYAVVAGNPARVVRMCSTPKPSPRFWICRGGACRPNGSGIFSRLWHRTTWPGYTPWAMTDTCRSARRILPSRHDKPDQICPHLARG